MDTMIMLHHLRNPYGIDEVEMREARRQAADELERLYLVETKVKYLIEALIEFKNDLK